MANGDPLPSLFALLRATIGDILVDGTSFLDLCADDILFEFPYAPADGVHRLEGKEALAAYLPGVGKMVRIDRLVPTTVHRTSDSEVVILEFFAEGSGVATGIPYDQRYISVIRVRDGLIVHYKDYWNPLVAIRAAGGDAGMREALGSQT